MDVYSSIQSEFNSSHNTKISISDLIILGGSVGVEKASSNAGFDISVPFTIGRVDASTLPIVKGTEISNPAFEDAFSTPTEPPRIIRSDIDIFVLCDELNSD